MFPECRIVSSTNTVSSIIKLGFGVVCPSSKALFLKTTSTPFPEVQLEVEVEVPAKHMH